MSIRTNPMKAVPSLLKRLVTVEHQANLNDLKLALKNIKDLFSMVKKNEEELLDTLTVVDGYLRNHNVRKLMEEKDDICKRIMDSKRKLLPSAQSPAKTSQDEKPDKRDVNKALASTSLQHEDLHMFEVNFKNLDPLQRHCFLSLLSLPENAVMKKRNIILWWVRAVFVKMETEKKGKENGEDVFDKLMEYKLIVPHGNDKYAVVNKFKINPRVRSLFQNDEKQFSEFDSKRTTSSHHRGDGCLVLRQKKVKPSDEFGSKSTHCGAVFNVGASYLKFGPQWTAKMESLEVLELGRWLQDSPKHHIEVENEEFLKELRDQNHLMYLSLRGISRISQLPSSIFQLENLETLDLKACHNLETLPNDISSLRNLIHLDLSQCYLLDRMPKGIDKLAKLEVLKGFVIGSSSKTPCKISDLAHLSKLKQLSIHIGSGAVVQDREFESLKDLSELQKLKISWGVFDKRYGDIQISLPSNLKKLHLEGFPGQDIPKWLKPDKLGSSLYELTISGGKLESMDLQGYALVPCSLQIIRFKYLEHLNIN